MSTQDPGGFSPGNSSNLMQFDNSKCISNMAPGQKFLIMRRINGNKSMKGISPFMVNRVIDTVAGKLDKMNLLRDGTLLMKTSDAKQANKLVKLTAFNSDIKVEVIEHQWLNKIRGVIKCRELIGVSDDEVLYEMKNQYVTEIYRLKKKLDRDETEEIGTYFLTFSTSQLPDYVNIGYIRCRVYPYIPNPMRCVNCLQFNHKKDKCENPTMCANCGDQYHLADEKSKCEKPLKCVNCLGEHNSLDRRCPEYKKNKAINRIKVIEQLSIYEARKVYAIRNPLQFQRQTFAEKVKENVPIENAEKNQKSINTDKNEDYLNSSPENDIEMETPGEITENTTSEVTHSSNTMPPETPKNKIQKKPAQQSTPRRPQRSRNSSSTRAADNKITKPQTAKNQNAMKETIRRSRSFIKDVMLTPEEEEMLDKMSSDQ